MIKLLTYYEINPRAWQKLVDESPCATWFQTLEAYQFYASQKNEMIPLAIGVEEDGALVGVVVGYITKKKNALKQFLTRRAIIVGGPLLAENISDEALTALLLAVTNTSRLSPSRVPGKVRDFVGCSFASRLQKPIYIETRNFNDYSRWKSVFEANGFAYQPHLNFHLNCKSDNILSPMSESRRRQIRKAIKNGARIEEAQSEIDVRSFYSILSELYVSKVKMPLFSLDFFLSFYRNEFGKFLLVKDNDIVIGGIMCPILYNNTIYEWFVCGQDEKYKDLYPSVMATYAAIEYAHKNCISKFDFMGAGKPDEAYGVRDFKARFGGEQVEYGRFLCVRKPLLYTIGKLGVKILKKR